MSQPINLQNIAILSVADRRAKTYRSQGNRKVLKMAKDQVYGLNNYESIKKAEQLSLFGKTSLELFATDLEKFCGAFPKAGTMRNGKLSAQPPLERHTLESESFSLPTPQAYSFQKSRRPGQTKLDVKLRSLLPTPTAHLAKETGAPSEAMRGTPSLHYQLGLTTGQVLAPQFVEWMQGFQPHWTDIQIKDVKWIEIL